MTDIQDIKGMAVGDFAQPFLINQSNIRGRVIRLNESVDAILAKHDYPEAVSRLLGELLVVAAMLSGNLKEKGVLTLQLKGEGLLRFMVADVEHGGRLRGYAEMNEGGGEALARMEKEHRTPSFGDLVGDGYLAITLDNLFNKQPYQGIVGFSGANLSDTVQSYFTNSEQSEVRLKIGVGTMQYGGEPRAQWCAAGMLLQHVPGEGGVARGWSPNAQTGVHERDDAEVAETDGVGLRDAADEAASHLPASEGPDPDLWNRIAIFYETLKPYELLDPLMPTEELLYRLFNEDGVWMYDATPLHAGCRCSRERVGNVLRSFPTEELETLQDEQGLLRVTCQFCNTEQNFTLQEVSAPAASA